MTAQLTVRLNDGRSIPQLGFGAMRLTGEEVRVALEAGYRAVDTASVYLNERGVGEGLRQSGVAREDVWITTKLFNQEQGYDGALAAFDRSQQRLGLDYIDLYLIHWPVPAQDLYVDTWKALIRLRDEGRAKSIGVSNFQPEHLQRLVDETGVVPAVNQIELHPKFQQRELTAAHARLGIATEAWSPLSQGSLLEDPVVAGIATKHGKTPAQVVLRWHMQTGVIAIPRSGNPERIRQNLDVFDFSLDDGEVAAISGMDDPAGTIGPDPRKFHGRSGVEAMQKAAAAGTL